MLELNLETNEPLAELTQDKDLFGTYEKMDFIKSFLESADKTNNIKNNMIALYGNWGSGKSTIINTLDKKLNDEKYKSIIFYAWKYEKDQNLAFSLYERLVDELECKEQKRNYLKTAWNLLKGGLRGINISLGVANLSPSEAIEGIEDAITEKSIDNSLYSRIRAFEKEFSKLIMQILGEENKLLFIFIDDLDRCEPDRILDLLSMVKMFFTFEGENNLAEESKILFFMGIDKEAVSKAIRKRYGEIIKSEEYLEKIFDISFNMPLESYNVEKYLNSLNIFNEKKELPIISDFLKKIEFKNPRHLKKITNKYRLLCYIKNAEKFKDYKLIPNIITGDGKGYIFDTVLSLYFIILYEFYKNKFYEIKNYGDKISSYYSHLIGDRSNEKTFKVHIKDKIDNNIKIVDAGNFLLFRNIDKVDLMNKENENSARRLFQFVHIFTPKALKNFSIIDLKDITYFDQFENADKDNKILLNFCKYLFKHIEQITTNQSGGRTCMEDYNLLSLFNMSEILL
ncbi:MAG: P-loop NTPase fold protein [Atribacterota bacterium]|nr:P-loop NTPase fold protein [Atribacterota bacterium]